MPDTPTSPSPSPQTATTNWSVQTVSAKRIRPLRHRILRTGMPPEAAIFDGDDLPATEHWAVLLNDEPVACCTLMHAALSGDCENAWQLRGMAVDTDQQGHGWGRKLLEAIDAEHDRADVVIWCNARVPAVGFYQRQGWSSISDVFDIPTAGPHIRLLRDMPEGAMDAACKASMCH